jgi:hypothetical protein
VSIRVCRIEDLKEHKRGRKPALQGLPELAALKTKLTHGLRPYEAVEIELPDKGVKNLRDSFKAHVVKYLRDLNILDYEVQAYKSGDRDYVAVVYAPPPTVGHSKPERMIA